MWVDSPCYSGEQARWGTIWSMFKRALRCTLFGHRGWTTWDDFPGGGMHFRTCYRCFRTWDWEGEPPPYVLDLQKRKAEELGITFDLDARDASVTRT